MDIMVNMHISKIAAPDLQEFVNTCLITTNDMILATRNDIHFFVRINMKPEDLRMLETLYETYKDPEKPMLVTDLKKIANIMEKYINPVHVIHNFINKLFDSKDDGSGLLKQLKPKALYVRGKWNNPNAKFLDPVIYEDDFKKLHDIYIAYRNLDSESDSLDLKITEDEVTEVVTIMANYLRRYDLLKKWQNRSKTHADVKQIHTLNSANPYIITI